MTFVRQEKFYEFRVERKEHLFIFLLSFSPLGYNVIVTLKLFNSFFFFIIITTNCIYLKQKIVRGKNKSVDFFSFFFFTFN